MVRALRCSSLALAYVIHRAIVQWLLNHDKEREAGWFKMYWMRVRGNYMQAHSEIGGTNNDNGTEGNWGGLKKAVCETAGSTACLPVWSVIPSLIRFISNNSKEEASHWREDTMKHCESTDSCMFSFPAIPYPIKEDWDHTQSLHPRVIQFSKMYQTGSGNA